MTLTNKDYLSQEEIDALLKQTSEDSGNDDTADLTTSVSVDDYLDPIEQDALGEIGNITFGSAATALSTLLGQKVEITTPRVSVVLKEELEEEFPQPHVAVHVRYVDGFQGINLLVIQTKDAQVIADLMLGGEGNVDEGQELNEIHVSAVQEAMNQMMGSSATSMSTIFNRFVNISPPGIDVIDLPHGEGTESLPAEDVFIKVSFRLRIGNLIDSNIMQLLPVSFAKDMVTILMGGGAEPQADAGQAQTESISTNESIAQSAVPESQAQPPAAQHQAPQQPEIPPQQPAAFQEPPVHPSYGEPMFQAPYPPQGPQHYGMNPSRNVQPVQYSSFGSMPHVQADDTNLNLLLDIPLQVSVELGRTKRLIKDILELSQGSIIELDKLAGEPVDILVNNKLIAKGEVVVIDENFGVRVTDIISQAERMQKIQ